MPDFTFDLTSADSYSASLRTLRDHLHSADHRKPAYLRLYVVERTGQPPVATLLMDAKTLYLVAFRGSAKWHRFSDVTVANAVPPDGAAMVVLGFKGDHTTLGTGDNKYKLQKFSLIKGLKDLTAFNGVGSDLELKSKLGYAVVAFAEATRFTKTGAAMALLFDDANLTFDSARHLADYFKEWQGLSTAAAAADSSVVTIRYLA